ncbi:MAG TPA: helicase-related protein, partial [Candidatus Limnocylindrales bacterium]
VKALGDFKGGRVAILVATDIAARGLDIELLPHVVNYELPMVAEDYVHRIGRTGRAGKDGEAISLVCVDERAILMDIQALLRRPIPTETIAGFEPNRNIRPEPIRLRSTPAERAERLASRGGQPSSRGGHPQRGGQHPASQGGQPGRGGASHRGRRRPNERPTGSPTPGSSIGQAPAGYTGNRRPPHGNTGHARALPGERLRRFDQPR